MKTNHLVIEITQFIFEFALLPTKMNSSKIYQILFLKH